jgi:argininosuccinate lyase
MIRKGRFNNPAAEVAQRYGESVSFVSDRDFVSEFLFCLAMIGLRLSRLSEDLIIWSTSEFGFWNSETHFPLVPV